MWAFVEQGRLAAFVDAVARVNLGVPAEDVDEAGVESGEAVGTGTEGSHSIARPGLAEPSKLAVEGLQTHIRPLEPDDDGPDVALHNGADGARELNGFENMHSIADEELDKATIAGAPLALDDRRGRERHREREAGHNRADEWRGADVV